MFLHVIVNSKYDSLSSPAPFKIGDIPIHPYSYRLKKHGMSGSNTALKRIREEYVLRALDDALTIGSRLSRINMSKMKVTEQRSSSYRSDMTQQLNWRGRCAPEKVILPVVHGSQRGLRP